jgi:hypothetical protein
VADPGQIGLLYIVVAVAAYKGDLGSQHITSTEVHGDQGVASQFSEAAANSNLNAAAMDGER